MALPEHVKRQAIDVVSHPETAKQLSLYRNNAARASPSDTFNAPTKSATAPAKSGESRTIPDDVKKQAMDAVGHKETTAQIRLVKDSGSVLPAGAGRQTNQVAERIASMHKDGHNADSIHRTATKDNFDRGG
jgi:hypothetical protein